MRRAIVYNSPVDSFGRYSFTLLWIAEGGYWGNGSRVRSQEFFASPKNYENGAKEFKTGEYVEAHRYLSNQIPGGEQVICQHCGMSKDLHSAPHEFEVHTEKKAQ